jgi:hypothetical protein
MTIYICTDICTCVDVFRPTHCLHPLASCVGILAERRLEASASEQQHGGAHKLLKKKNVYRYIVYIYIYIYIYIYFKIN